MAVPQVRGLSNALLVFADIVDSSKFSSVLGYEEYARRVIDFQELFKSLGERYFPPPKDKIKGYSHVNFRGDEGVIFCLEPRSEELATLVLRAIEFLYHLKGRLYFRSEGTKEDDRKKAAPLRMGIGAGIHAGPVAFATEVRDNRSEIVQIIGFSINKAKRVESSSRAGTFSKVVLSEEAARLLEGAPILFSPITASMKGIEEHAEVYEVRSGLLGGIILGPEDPAEEHLITQITRLADYPDLIDEPWLKSLVVSILDVLLTNSKVAQRRDEYRRQQLKLAWRSTIEDDPMLLYLRAKHYQEQEKYTQQIRYLRQVLEMHPDFVFAKKRMVDACWKIAAQAKERAERVFARDCAEEFLDRFSHHLSDKEKKEFTEIVKEVEKKAR